MGWGRGAQADTRKPPSAQQGATSARSGRRPGGCHERVPPLTLPLLPELGQRGRRVARRLEGQVAAAALAAGRQQRAVAGAQHLRQRLPLGALPPTADDGPRRHAHHQVLSARPVHVRPLPRGARVATEVDLAAEGDERVERDVRLHEHAAAQAAVAARGPAAGDVLLAAEGHAAAPAVAALDHDARRVEAAHLGGQALARDAARRGGAALAVLLPVVVNKLGGALGLLQRRRRRLLLLGRHPLHAHVALLALLILGVVLQVVKLHGHRGLPVGAALLQRLPQVCEVNLGAGARLQAAAEGR